MIRDVPSPRWRCGHQHHGGGAVRECRASVDYRKGGSTAQRARRLITMGVGSMVHVAPPTLEPMFDSKLEWSAPPERRRRDCRRWDELKRHGPGPTSKALRWRYRSSARPARIGCLGPGSRRGSGSALPVRAARVKALLMLGAPGRRCWSRWSARSEARTNDLDQPEGRCMLAMGRGLMVRGRPALPGCSTNSSSATTSLIGCPPR